MSILRGIRATFSNDLYVQLWAEKIKVANLDTKEIFSEETLVAIKETDKGQKVVEAIGAQARSLEAQPNMTIIRPFSHPRLLVSDFQVAEKLMQHMVRIIHSGKFFAPSPRIIFQPMEKIEGGVTDVERRVYRELCMSAGARETIVYLGTELSAENTSFDEVKRDTSS